MDAILLKKAEGIVGEIIKADRLPEQGATSVVRKIITAERSYLLKSARKDRYREWLKAEARVLERQNAEKLVRVPYYYGFIEEKDSSHLIMSFEDGVSLTSALMNANTLSEKKSLICSFGVLLSKLHSMGVETPNDKKNWLEKQLMKAEANAKYGRDRWQSRTS